MLTARQRRTLEALCARIAPAAEDTRRIALLTTAIATRIEGFSPYHRRRVLRALDAVAHPLLALIMTGRPRTFATLPLEVQDRLLLDCQRSRLFALRLMFVALKRLIVNTWYALPEAAADIGHLGPLHERNAVFAWEGPLPDARPVVAVATRSREQQRVVPPNLTEGSGLPHDLALSVEFCIIGSGVGGSVAACLLAEAGREVVVVEEGPYRTAADHTSNELQALQQLYAEAGMRATDDLTMSLLQGRCVGGGSIVNWMVMLRTPDYVLDEWQRHGVEGMSSSEMRSVFEKFEAENNVGVVADNAHSPVNRILLDGSRKLGWRTQPAKINARSCLRAGACSHGCPFDAKQSTLKTYLARAFDAGARMITDAHVQRIDSTRGGKTINARTAQGRQITIAAQYVIVASGAIETPALLQRSALGNANVGKHLRLHPTTPVVGVYDDVMYAGAGIPLSTYCNEFVQLRGDYGHWIETPPLGPGLAAIALPGFGAAHRAQMRSYRHLAPLIVLVRDGSPGDPSRGSVHQLRNGHVRMSFRLSNADRDILRHGTHAAARIHEAMGARQVLDLSGGSPRAGEPMLFSAHANGSCRMGGNAADNACTPGGELRGARGVYVMDGSLLPTAPGVNPHETIAATVTVLMKKLLSTIPRT